MDVIARSDIQTRGSGDWHGLSEHRYARAGINAGAKSLMQFSMTLNKFGEINRDVRMQDGSERWISKNRANFNTEFLQQIS